MPIEKYLKCINLPRTFVDRMPVLDILANGKCFTNAPVRKTLNNSQKMIYDVSFTFS